MKLLAVAGCKLVWRYNLWKVSLTVDMTSGHSSHVFPSPPAWHLSIISLVGMPGSCHHHHGNVSVLPVTITMAMGVSPSNHQHGPNVSLLTRITMAICAWYVRGYVWVCVGERQKKKWYELYHQTLVMEFFSPSLSSLSIVHSSSVIVFLRHSFSHLTASA